jgi:hypothetical protein
MPKKTIDQEIDELFNLLPSDEEIKKETANVKRKQFGNSEEWKQFTRRLNERDSWKENNATANKKRNDKIENRLAFEEGMKKRDDNEKWHQNVKKAAQNRDQSWFDSHKKAKEISGTPIITPEGIFLKFTEGVKYYMPIWNLKKGGADYKLRKLLNDENNKDFIRISLEEYIMLTGKDN